MQMLRRLLRAEGQGRAAKTVEIYGWIASWPREQSACSGLSRWRRRWAFRLVDQALNYFRPAGVGSPA
jgi:hypothetical protein